MASAAGFGIVAVLIGVLEVLPAFGTLIRRGEWRSLASLLVGLVAAVTAICMGGVCVRAAVWSFRQRRALDDNSPTR